MVKFFKRGQKLDRRNTNTSPHHQSMEGLIFASRKGGEEKGGKREEELLNPVGLRNKGIYVKALLSSSLSFCLHSLSHSVWMLEESLTTHLFSLLTCLFSFPYNSQITLLTRCHSTSILSVPLLWQVITITTATQYSMGFADSLYGTHTCIQIHSSLFLKSERKSIKHQAVASFKCCCGGFHWTL